MNEWWAFVARVPPRIFGSSRSPFLTLKLLDYATLGLHENYDTIESIDSAESSLAWTSETLDAHENSRSSCGHLTGRISRVLRAPLPRATRVLHALDDISKSTLLAERSRGLQRCTQTPLFFLNNVQLYAAIEAV